MTFSISKQQVSRSSINRCASLICQEHAINRITVSQDDGSIEIANIEIAKEGFRFNSEGRYRKNKNNKNASHDRTQVFVVLNSNEKCACFTINGLELLTNGISILIGHIKIDTCRLCFRSS